MTVLDLVNNYEYLTHLIVKLQSVCTIMSLTLQMRNMRLKGYLLRCQTAVKWSQNSDPEVWFQSHALSQTRFFSLHWQVLSSLCYICSAVASACQVPALGHFWCYFSALPSNAEFLYLQKLGKNKEGVVVVVCVYGRSNVVIDAFRTSGM